MTNKTQSNDGAPHPATAVGAATQDSQTSPPAHDDSGAVLAQGADDLDDPEQKLGSNPSKTTDPIEVECGHLIIVDGDKVSINQPAFAAKYVKVRNAAYSEQDGQHYTFNATEGIWCKSTRKAAMWRVGAFLKDVADEMKVPELLPKRTPALLSGILQLVEGRAPMGISPPPSAKLVPVANGVLDLSGLKPVLRSYRQEDWFTHKVPIAYVEGAKCERYLNDLIRPALPNEDDINLLQRDLGRQLVAGNDAQTISVIFGEGGSGKSVLVSILETLLGPANFGYLRSDKLNGRFETHAFHGKCTLVGKDVKPDYLDKDGAAMIKSLTGADRIESEKKYGGKFTLRGGFYVLITANSRLPIKLQGDASAWRRRLVCYNFSREIPVHRIPNFDEELNRTEGEGILVWLVDGYMAHQKELAEHGTLKLTEAQQKRVDDWIMESEGERAFARMRISKGPSTLAVEEIWNEYTQFARDRGWLIPSKQKFFTKLPEVMLDLFGAERDNHIMRNGAAVRGFKGVAFKNAEVAV